MSYVKIGVAGPVGSGKTALIECLTRQMASEYSIGVITNDIYTKEDAEFLSKNSVLPRERITGVETGGCPHTAIREDASMNLEAVEEMMEKFPDIQLLFIESGGDNLSATFSPELVDATIFRGRQDPAKRRTWNHQVRSSRHQQDRPGSVCRCGPFCYGKRLKENARRETVPFYKYPRTGRHRCRDRLDQEKCTSGRMLKRDDRK